MKTNVHIDADAWLHSLEFDKTEATTSTSTRPHQNLTFT